MIQGGCPIGSGTGGPGYAFDDEISPDKDFTGPTCSPWPTPASAMGKGTNGSQFFITVGPTPRLQGKHTIFGEVADGPSREVVDKIAAVPDRCQGQAASSDVVIESVVVQTTDHARRDLRGAGTANREGTRMTEPDGRAAGDPVCPRHPDRVSYVRCQRCGRPICPECQRPAAVGVQCVDCVREAPKSVRTGAHRVRRRPSPTAARS